MVKHVDALDLNALVNLKLNLEKLVRAMLCSVRSEFEVRNRVISLALSIFLGLVATITTASGLQPSSVQTSYEDLTRTVGLSLIRGRAELFCVVVVIHSEDILND